MLTDEFRPQTWDEVIGNEAAVKVFRRAIETGSTKCFLLEGPTGVGKTTLARIAAKELRVHPNSVLEANGASERGIDYWREVREHLRMMPLSGNFKMFLVDEAQGLTKDAWESLLKDTEEPPAHVYWFFCTTKNAVEFPKTILGRLLHIPLRLPTPENLRTLLKRVSHANRFQLSENVQKSLVYSADGSFRRLLRNLEAIQSLDSSDEQLDYLNAHEQDTESVASEIKDLMLALSDRVFCLSKVLDKLRQLPEPAKNPYSIQQITLAWFSSVAVKTPSNSAMYVRAIQILDAFSPALPSTTKLAGIILSIERLRQMCENS